MPFCYKLFSSKIVNISFTNYLSSAFQATREYKLFRDIIVNYKIKYELIYKYKLKDKLGGKLKM